MKGFARSFSLSEVGRWLLQFDERHRWVKYLLFPAVILPTLFLAESNIFEFYKLKERQLYLNSEIDDLRPRLTQDSLRLEQLREQSHELEHIARERYLMKAPGEEIFIIQTRASEDKPKD